MEAENLVLVDTSIWVPALRRHSGDQQKKKLGAVLSSGLAALTEVVLYELWQGVRSRVEEQHLRQLENELPVLSIGPPIWRRSYALGRSCREKGLRVPLSDVLIAACALEHKITVLHDDEHFHQIQGVLEPGIFLSYSS